MSAERMRLSAGRVRLLALAGGLGYTALSLAGALAWVLRTRPASITPRIEGPGAPALHDPQPTNLASIGAGARVRASSWDWFRRHHPLFAIDEERSPTVIEKWVSAPGDSHPWIEVVLARPSRIETVVLTLARDLAGPIAGTYEIVCRTGDKVIGRLRIVGNDRREVAHDLRCDRADAVRLAFDALGPPPHDVARVYEMRVMGRP